MSANDSPSSFALADALRRTSRSVVAAQIASQVVSLGVLCVLYRQLGLHPYGLVGMVMPLLALVRIVVASGLDVVIVQQAEMSDQQVSALFWVSQALGWAMALVTAGCAPLVARFYGVPELTSVTLALAGTSVLFVLGFQHQALLQRRLRLATLAWSRLAALGLGGAAAIGLALAGLGVWALVAQQYVELVLLAGLAWWAEPWRPRRMLRGAGSRRLVGFGRHYLTSSLMAYLVTNVDKILVGRLLGEAALALYSQAFSLVMKPVHVLSTPLTGVMLPALSRAAANHRHYTALVLGFFRFIFLAMLPAGVGLALVAPEAMLVLGGPQWEKAGPILAVLALLVPLQTAHNALGSVLASAGQSKRLALASVAGAMVLGACFSLGLWLGSLAGSPLLGIALGYTLGMLLVVFPAYLAFALRSVRVPLWAWLAQLHPAAPATAAMALTVVATRWLACSLWDLGQRPLALLAAEMLIGVATYAVFSRRAIGWFLREGLRDLG